MENPYIDKPEPTTLSTVNPYLEAPTNPYLDNSVKQAISEPLENNKLYGEGTPFYNIAKTVGKAVLDSPIGDTVKTVLGFTKENYDNIIQQQKIGEIQFQAMTHTPNFEYYANAAIRSTMQTMVNNPKMAVEAALSPGSTILNAIESLPSHFNLPDSSKYSPAFIALAKLSGGDLSKVNDKMWLGAGIDQLSFMGLEHLSEMVAKGGSEALKSVQSMDNYSKLMMDKDVAAAKYAGMTQEDRLKETFGPLDLTTLEGTHETYNPKPDILKPVILGDEAYKNKTPFEEMVKETEIPLTPSELLDKTDHSQVVYNDVVYKMSINADGKSISINPIRPATQEDITNHLYKEAALIRTDAMGKDIKSIYDFLPQEGQIDVSPERFTKYGPMAIVQSPQTYAPVLFDQISMLERQRARLGDSVFGEVTNFIKQSTKESHDKVGRYLNYPWKIEKAIKDAPETVEALKQAYADLSQSMTPFEMKYVEAAKNAYGKAADIMNIPKSADYFTHVMEDFAQQEYHPSPDLNFNKEIGDRYLKERLGVEGYTNDAGKAISTYRDWFVKKMLDNNHKPMMLETIKKMKEFDKAEGWFKGNHTFNISGDLAELYFHNYFGTIRQELPALAKIKDLSNVIASWPTAAWLTLNPNPILLNTVQALAGGSAKIGYGPMARGIVHAFEALYGKSEQALAWRKILNDGAVLAQKSMTQISPTKTFWEKIPGVGKLFLGSKQGLQWAENTFKASIYLGGYEDAFQKAKSTEFGVKNWSKWLSQRGIDVSKDHGTEAFKYGRTAAYDAHADWTKAGQTTLQILPFSNIAMRFGQTPYKMAEFATKSTLGAASNIFGKALNSVLKGDLSSASLALSHPSVKTALRLGINYSLLTAFLSKTGYDASRFAWDYLQLPKHTGRLINFVINDFNKMTDQWHKQDPRAIETTMKYIGTLAGFPLINSGGKVMHIMSIANDPVNQGRNDGKVYIRDPRNPNTGYWSDWTHVMVDTLTPSADMNKVEHYDSLKESSDLSHQITNSRKAERMATYQGDYEKRKSLIKQRIQSQIEQRQLNQRIREANRGSF